MVGEATASNGHLSVPPLRSDGDSPPLVVAVVVVVVVEQQVGDYFLGLTLSGPLLAPVDYVGRHVALVMAALPVGDAVVGPVARLMAAAVVVHQDLDLDEMVVSYMTGAWLDHELVATVRWWR